MSERANGERKFRRTSDTASRTIEGKAVLVLQKRQTLHTLNRSGTFLWDHVGAKPFGLNDLRSALIEKFDLPEEDAERDAHAFLDALVEVGACMPLEKTNGRHE